MALSGSLTSGEVEGRSITLYWQASQSVANNTSTINWQLKGSGSFTGRVSVREVRVTIANVVRYYHDTSQVMVYPDQQLASGSLTVSHNNDGTGSFSATVEAAIYQQWSIMSSLTQSKTFTLDTIARASQPSCITWPDHTQDVGDMGNLFYIHMNRKSASFTHTVKYWYGSKTGTIDENVENNTSWTIPVDFSTETPNGTSGSGSIIVDTYNGSTKIGTKSCSFTCHVPSSVVPSCSVSVAPDNGTDEEPGHVAKYGGYVQGVSSIPLTIAASGKYSSSISSYRTVVDGTTYTSANPSVVVNNTSGNNISVSTTVTDSRGRTKTATATISKVLPYSKPTVECTLMRVGSLTGTTEELTGDYCRLTYTTNIATFSVDKKLKIEYKESSGSSYTVYNSGPITITNSTGSVVFPASSESAYDIKVTVIDDFNSVPLETSLSTGFAIMHISPTGKGISFGRISNTDKFEVGQKADFYEGLRFKDSSGNWIDLEKTDYIIESGFSVNNSSAVDSGKSWIWYEKWASGKLIIRGYSKMNSDYSCSISSWSSGYETPVCYVCDSYPVNFSELPSFSVVLSGIDSPRAAADYKILYGNPAGGKYTDTEYMRQAAPYFKLWRGSTVTFSKPAFSWVAEGFWKKPSYGVNTPFTQATPTPPNTGATATPSNSSALAMYPVGSIYMSVMDTNPSTIFGGTWERFGKGKTLVGVDEDDTDFQSGSTGGEKTHTLSESEMPSHTHGQKGYTWDWGTTAGSVHMRSDGNVVSAWSGAPPSGSNGLYTYQHINNTSESVGSGSSHNNLQPYITCYMWLRTA